MAGALSLGMNDNNTAAKLNSIKASEEAHLSAIMATIPTPTEWNTTHSNPYSPTTLTPPRPNSFRTLMLG